MKTTALILFGCLIVLGHSMTVAPSSGDGRDKGNLNRFRCDSLEYYRQWNEVLQQNNAQLYSDLLGWYDHANRMRVIWGIPDSLEMSYKTKCLYLHGVHPVYGGG